MNRPTVGNVIVYPAKGGLETISVPGTTTLGRLSDGYNFIVDINGSKRKHPGAINLNPTFIDSIGTQVGAPAGASKGVFDFWRTNGFAKARRNTLVANGRIYADNNDSTYIDVTGSFSIIPNDNVSMETFFGLLVMAFENNPSAAPLKFDQTTIASLGGTPPNGKYLRTWLNRLWIAGIYGAPDRLRASAPDNPEDWTFINGSEEINIDQGDQDPIGITALFPPFYGRLFVAKRRSIYQVTYDGTNFAVDNTITGLGCISHNGVAGTDTDVIYPSERGINSIVMTNKLGQVDSSFLSSSIQDFYQQIVSFDRAENMRAIYAPEINSYLLALTSKYSTTNDYVFGYNFQLGEWYIWQENVAAFSKFVDKNDSNKTKIQIINDKGQVGYLDMQRAGRTVTWFGEQRTTQFTTGIIYPLGVRKEVTFRALTVYFKPQSATNSVLNVSYSINAKFVESVDFSMGSLQVGSLIGSSTIGVAKIGTQGVVKHVTRQFHGDGDAIEMVFTHTPTSDDDDCEIYGFVIEYEYSGETDLPKQQ